MKFYDEENLCWADVLFWVFVGGAILVGGYGIISWVSDWMAKF